MSVGSAWSVAMIGMEATMVEVESAIGNGLPRTVLVGLPDAALYEARDRCRAAFAGTHLSWPDRLLTINLTPASLPKAGTHYDLAIISSVLISDKVVPPEVASRAVSMGEVGLDGRVHGVRGLLPSLLMARKAGFELAIVPACQVGEASLVDGMTVWGVEKVSDLIEVLHGRPVLTSSIPAAVEQDELGYQPDFSEVLGQSHAKWALEVAAAGRHHLFMHGSPGVGKTMLAERLPSILPDLTEDQALEVSAVHSLVGEDLNGGLITRPPFYAPHHSASMAAMVGGGARIARPGAVSLAHNGVLFLDEAPEFGPKIMDALRTPLESGFATISRSQVSAKFPAKVQLIMASNPCPCGTAGQTTMCNCTPLAIRRYQSRISGPIMDRIDIRVELMPARKTFFGIDQPIGESSNQIKQRVLAARERAAWRLRETRWLTNGEIPGSVLRTTLPLPANTAVLDRALARGKLSSRGVDKVLRLAWTLADLGNRAKPNTDDLQAAMVLRNGEVTL